MEDYNMNKGTLISVDGHARAEFMEITKWTKFLAIVGYIFIGFLIFGGILMVFGVQSFSELYGTRTGWGIGILFGYLFTALLYFFPTHYLYKYSTLMKAAIMQEDQVRFNLALSFQRKLFRFIGILLLILICLYVLFFMFALIGVAIS